MIKRFTGMLLALLLTLTMFPLAAGAADNTGSFGFTENPRENIRFILGNNKLTVTNLPNNAAFSSVWVNIVNLDGRVLIKQILDRTEDGDVSMSLSGLNSGKYYIELYFSTSGNPYTSYIFGDELRFQWSNGSGSFILSPVYEHNKKTFKAGRSDNAALAYYLNSTSMIQSSDAGIVKLADEITKGITNEYNKALAIHDWVCINIWYDWDMAGSGRRTESDAVSTLKNRRSICNGYANLTAALLRAAGIPAKNVTGYGRISAKTGGWTQSQISGKDTNHVWNEAYVDGRWIIIDTTWDSGNDYRGGKKTASDGLYYGRYFDTTLEAISIDHRIEPYPESSIPQPDAPSLWASQQVDAAIASGLVPRIMRVKYSQTTTRAEFCALATALYETVTGKEISGRVKFNDTTDVSVEKMAHLGVVYGVGGNKFSPNEPLNREQAAIMFSRLADKLGYKLTSEPVTFDDRNNVSPWAIEAVGKMQSSSLMGSTGGNAFSPKAKLPREQCIVTIARLYDAVR